MLWFTLLKYVDYILDSGAGAGGLIFTTSNLEPRGSRSPTTCLRVIALLDRRKPREGVVADVQVCNAQ